MTRARMTTAEIAELETAMLETAAAIIARDGTWSTADTRATDRADGIDLAYYVRGLAAARILEARPARIYGRALDRASRRFGTLLRSYWPVPPRRERLYAEARDLARRLYVPPAA